MASVRSPDASITEASAVGPSGHGYTKWSFAESHRYPSAISGKCAPYSTSHDRAGLGAAEQEAARRSRTPADVASKLPDGLNRGRSSDRPHPDRATWLRRGLLTVPGILVLLGLANVFGQRASESEAQSPAADLTVEAPAHLRGGLMFQVRIQVLAHRRISHPVIMFSHAWYESMTQNSVNPQPASGSSVGDRPAFEFSPIAAGHRATYWFEFQVNPTNVGWRRPENLTLADGTTTLASVQRTLTVYP